MITSSLKIMKFGITFRTNHLDFMANPQLRASKANTPNEPVIVFSHGYDVIITKNVKI